nr:PREDICTED: saccharopine dehydrogenase-like oxidoreductase [Bemisia tabaci]XP_018917010.1 PREDICTED: saccharopine dehydrogenase-like oxidoreductase [Bemisia tabaci]XP_018917011.1 PREDICTED: saccharopine dehydrogenase-like oxidoreductase [Bemisia tabaci]
MSHTRLDLLIFGATGFTGQFVVTEIVRLAKEHGNLTWGIAGRNIDKLKAALDKSSEKTGVDLSTIPIVLADVKDEESLKEMAQKTKVVINCCGPYRFFGEPVVKACVENGASHVDVSGEPQFMESMQLKYHKAAEENGVYIVSACGFDCIPADLGTIFLQKHFEGGLNSVEIFLKPGAIKTDKKIKRGAAIHYGTWASAVYGLAHANELSSIRSKLYPQRLPAFQPKLKPRPVIHKNEVVNGRWCLPFLGADRSVVMRSQRHFYDTGKERPVQVCTYMVVQNFLAVIGLIIFGAFFLLMSNFELGRKILLQYPKLCSFGFVSHEGPPEEQEKHTVISFVFHGKGWSEKEKADSLLPNKTVISKITLKSPGYGFTATAVILSAVMILKESKNMPSSGGVYPPAAAFAKTSLIEELMKNDAKFEVISTLTDPGQKA